MLSLLRKLFASKSAETEAVAPYKIESKPKSQGCGCGRSPSGLCEGLHSLSADEWAVHAKNPEAKKPAKIKAEKKPAVKKATTKQPRKPRTPKV